MLVDGVMLGTDEGQVNTELAMGVKDVGGVDWEMVNAEAREWASQYAGQLVQGLNDTTLKALRTAIAEWIGNTLTYEQLLAELAGVFGLDRAKRIAETEITRAYAEGSRRAWMAGGIITEMIWRTANDERRCSYCGQLNGQVTSVSEPHFEYEDAKGIRQIVPNPPAHVRCRCWVVAEVKRA